MVPRDEADEQLAGLQAPEPPSLGGRGGDTER